MNTANFRTIDLDKLNSDDPLSLDGLIFSDEAKELKRRILFSRETGNASCYFISGVRGAGKSTFLKALQEDLNKHPHFGHLFPIDPSELDENEHFFLYFISRIERFVEENLTAEEHKSRKYIIHKHLGEMAEGLFALSHPMMTDTDFVDANLYLENAVNRCKSSADLKKKFCELMSTLSDAFFSAQKGIEHTDNQLSRASSSGCGKTEKETDELPVRGKFFVTIDDADMNPAKCYEITECIRKYMLNEHLFFIFTGDLKLYSMVIRGNQMDHFTRQAWQYDSKGQEARFQMLESIGMQYLLKMFPADNRVHLPSPQRIFDEKERYAFTHKNPSAETPVSCCVYQFLKSAVGEDRIPRWKSFIEDLPLRSALQLFGYFTRASHGLSVNGQVYADLVTASLMQVFSPVFHLHDINAESIHADNLAALFHTVISILKKEEYRHLLDDGYSKQYNIFERIVSLYIGAEVARQTNTPARKLLWFCSLFPYMEAYREGAMEVRPQFPATLPTDGGFGSSIGSILNKEASVYAQWGAEMTALVKGWTQDAEKKLLEPIKVPDKVAKLLFNDSLFPLLPDDEDVKLVIALRHVISTISGSSGKSYYFSVFNLISVMVNCLIFCNHHADGCNVNDRLEAILMSNALPVNADEISTTADAIQETHDNHPRILTPMYEPYYDKRLSNVSSILGQIIEDIRKWANACRDIHIQSYPYHYTKAWQRFMQRSSVDITAVQPEDLSDEFRQAYAGFHAFAEQLQHFEHAFISLIYPVSESTFPVNEDMILHNFPLWETLASFVDESDCAEIFFRRLQCKIRN